MTLNELRDTLAHNGLRVSYSKAWHMDTHTIPNDILIAVQRVDAMQRIDAMPT